MSFLVPVKLKGTEKLPSYLKNVYRGYCRKNGIPYTEESIDRWFLGMEAKMRAEMRVVPLEAVVVTCPVCAPGSPKLSVKINGEESIRNMASIKTKCPGCGTELIIA
jgi:hypothetical protein